MPTRIQQVSWRRGKNLISERPNRQRDQIRHQARFGLVTYEDSIIYQAALSDKVDIVKSNISTNFHAVERWSDFSEAGFFAAKTALDLAKDGDTVKVLFLATDAYSHDGGGIDGNRTYDSSALVETFAAPNMKMSFLFTATDPRGGSGNLFNIPSGTAQAQWDQVRSKAGVKGKDYDIAGFSTSTVSEDIPKAIAAGLHKCK